MGRSFFSVLVMALTLCQTAQADLILDRSFVEFLPSDLPRKDLMLRNSGATPLYVDIEVSRIDSPGTDAEQRKSDTDPRKTGLLVSPSRMKLDPGASRKLRLTLLKRALLKDEVFRVKISPSADAFDEQAITQLRVLIAYDALVIARPPNADPRLRVERNGRELTFNNRGNTSVLFYNGQQCDQQQNNCKSIPGLRVYAGTDVTIQLPYPDSPVRFLRSSNEQETLTAIY